MNYEETLQWLYAQLPMFSRTGAAAYKPGLERVEELDRIAGHPHGKYKTIHIAGTNGKGSVSHNLASILQEQGYKTGLYTSPHLVDFRERIRVNGNKIPKEAVVGFIEEFRTLTESLKPSFFELTMMMAFGWFAKENVDVAVIETGMGGRLDSTNIITPVLSIVTNISKDHTQFLGETLEAIAREKAGIIKADVPVVIGEAGQEVRKVFESQAENVGTSIRFAEDNPMVGDDIRTEDFTDVNGVRYSSPLGGEYQKKNLNTLLTAIDELRNRSVLNVTDDGVRRGIAKVCENTGLMGRWMKIQDAPLAIADTGHNVAGLQYNFNQLSGMMSGGQFDRLRLLLGFVADKDVDSILRLIPRNSELYLCQASIPRAMLSSELAEKCEAEGLRVSKHRIFDNVTSGWKKICEESDVNDLIYVGGSTFVVADFLEGLNIRRDESILHDR